MKPIAFVFSDLHLHDWEQFNVDWRRTNLQMEFVRHIQQEALDHGCHTGLFLGDWWNTKKNISTRLMEYSNRESVIIRGINIYGITGNHDGYVGSDGVYYSHLHWMDKLYKGFRCMDYQSITINIHKPITLHGVPYLLHNVGFRDAVRDITLESGKNILMIHTDLYGAKDNDGREVKSVTNIPRDMHTLFDRFDLVLCGHIHKPQRILDNVLMVGAPMRYRTIDAGAKLGYWWLYEDMSLKFKVWKSPDYKYYDGDIPPDDYDFWIKSDSEVKDEFNQEENAPSTISIKRVVKKYCKEKGVRGRKKSTLMGIINEVK